MHGLKIATKQDDVLMGRALEVAQRACGLAEPNPTVGAVLARGDQIIAEGWTSAVGGPHAEINALQAASDARGATLYSTLEPCCHHGKTPPCSDAVIAAGVTRVVIGMEDPFAKVAGRGVSQLRAAGIDVTVGVRESEVRRLHAPFIKRVTTGLPWVIAKWAQTVDGKIATASHDSKWISGSASRKHVHELRARMDAIVTGIGTALADDPTLTARGVDAKRVAQRIVIDPNGDLPANAKLRQGDSPALIWPTFDAAHLATLGEPTNVLIEAGGGLVGQAMRDGLVDELRVFIAPKLAGDTEAIDPVRGMKLLNIADTTDLALESVEQIGADVLLCYTIKRA